MSDKNFFKRLDFKYIIDIKQRHAILSKLNNFAKFDVNSKNGFYKVGSIYYDTSDLKFYYEKIYGNRVRRKLRLRGYNNILPDNEVFVEVKKKINKETEKMRLSLPLRHAYEFLSRSYNVQEKMRLLKAKEDEGIVNEILYLENKYLLEPKVVITYDRIALGVLENNLRITFDTNLRCRSYDLALEKGHSGIYLLPPQFCVMEMKVNNCIPEWLKAIISEQSLTPQSFSKYCASVERIVI